MTTRLIIRSTSNRMFNPTNLGMSDFSLVATTLDKLCVEYKSFLMDLKLLPRNGEDNKAQAEQYALAA